MVKRYEEFINESRIYTTAIVALFYKNKILVLQRSSTAPWMPNKWSLVGGVIREVKEEINLIPYDIEFIQKKRTKDGYISYFTGSLKSDKVKLNFENSNYKFIDKKEILSLNVVPYIKEFIYGL